MAKDIKFSGPLVGHILAKQEHDKAKAKKAAIAEKVSKLLKGGKK